MIAEYIDRIVIFAAAGFSALQILRLARHAGANPVGKPPIARPAFLLAKLCLVVSLCSLLLTAALNPPHLAILHRTAFLCLLLGGTAMFSISMSQLGGNLRMGLPEEQTVLVTSGIYRFSRNPIYVALYSLLAASVLYASSWVNCIAAIIATVLHHRIVLSEERFLAGRFKEFADYRKRVRRYI